MTTPSLHLHLWAKSDPQHSLWCHLLDVAAVCEALLPRFGGVEDIPKPWLLLLVALHDIGKADAQFQNKDPQQKARLEGLGLELEPEPNVTHFRHEARSAGWLASFLKEKGWGRDAGQVVTGAIRGHHGNFAAGLEPGQFYIETAKSLARWSPLREALAALVMDTLGIKPYALDRFQDAGAAGTKLSGLIVLSDWIASNHEQYAYNDPARLSAELPPPEYWEAAQAEAKRAVHRLELTPPEPSADKSPTFTTLWPGFNPRPIQAALENECRNGLLPGLAIVEAPMGEGKTEGAIYLAECWNRQTGRAGVYFALPTMATSNQMHGRYQDYLERTSPGAAPRLVHGLSWLIDEVSPQEAAQTFGTDGGGENNSGEDDEPLSREWFRPAKRALLASHGVGTVDQALGAALNVKHGFLRFLGLSAKTLIVDEVHAYDAYMNTLLCRLLSWCRVLGIPVILLSATLSRAQKEQLCAAYAGRNVLPPSAAEEPYPLLTFVPLAEVEKNGGGETARIVPVSSDPPRTPPLAWISQIGMLDNPVQTAALAAAQSDSGGCVCVVVNTVAAAQETFRALQAMQERGKLPEDTRLLLFHARFRAERREEIEKAVLALFGKDANPDYPRPKRAILVATQVVEQSLDIDFDVMLSQIAPVDLLLQRSGRIWRHVPDPRHAPNPRHADRPRYAHNGPALHLLLPEAGSFEFGGSGRVYSPELLLRTLVLLRNRAEISLPADFRPLIEACYSPSAPPPKAVPPEVFQKAVTERRKAQEHAEDEASEHLIPAPDTEVFKLAQAKKAVSEAEEGERASFLHAQTRLGDQTVAALVLHDPALHDPDLMDLVRQGIASPKAPPPPLAQMRRLFRQKVNLPAWWLKEATAAPGFEIISEGPKWLRHHIVLGFRNGVWQGEYTQRDGKHCPVTIEDHPQEGLRLRDQSAPPAKDADANLE